MLHIPSFTVALVLGCLQVEALAQTATVLSTAERLTTGFQRPPLTVRPRVYWFWMGKNVTRQGITADLEAMKEAGLGGFIHLAIPDSVASWDTFEIANSPMPDHRMLSEKWWDLLAFSASEAGRLGLFFDLHVNPGWSTCGGPWITPEHSMQILAFSRVEVNRPGPLRITLPKPDAKPLPDRCYENTTYDTKGFYRDVAVIAVPKTKDGDAPDFAHGVDISSHMRPDGQLDWRPPAAGPWIIYRIGHGSTGICIHHCPAEARGLEADKWSEEAIEISYRAYTGKLLRMLDADGRKGLRAIHIDSFEAGPQNWTETFREAFRQRRGYDPLPYLPVLSVDPRTVKDESDRRFLYDFRQTGMELFAERFYGKMAELAHKDGLLFSCEPYGRMIHVPEIVSEIDYPMDEFWHAGPGNKVAMPSVYAGKPIVGAEAFTCYPQYPDAKLTAVPMTFIPRAHAAFLRGINMLYFHSYAHQPFSDRVKPGMVMGQWGTQISRTTTWWDQSRPFFDYLARCQYLLQQGVRVIDVLDMRYCPAAVFLNDLQVRDGRVFIPDGNSFAWIQLTGNRTMRLDYARRLKELVAEGAVVVGPKPNDAPGLEGYPASLAEVRAIAEGLWGNCDGKGVRRHRYGKGMVLWNDDPADAVADYVCDFRVVHAARGTRFDAIHRRTPEADIYFVVNNGDRRGSGVLQFRVTGVQPELWDPADGSIQPAAAWSMSDRLTEVAVELESQHAVFVVFRGSAEVKGRGLETGERAIAIEGPVEETMTQPPPLLALGGSWEVGFPPGWGAPDKIILPRLMNLSKHEISGVKYFSGTAEYRKEFSLSKAQIARLESPVLLDLGSVCHVVTVKLNGKELGVLWRPPYRVEVTRRLRAGVNKLQLFVTNTWVNRLIGDQQEPDDCTWHPDLTRVGQNIGAPLKAFPGWFADYMETGNRPSQGRYTFVVWNKYTKDSPLPESGLIGPVTLATAPR